MYTEQTIKLAGALFRKSMMGSSSQPKFALYDFIRDLKDNPMLSSAVFFHAQEDLMDVITSRQAGACHAIMEWPGVVNDISLHPENLTPPGLSLAVGFSELGAYIDRVMFRHAKMLFNAAQRQSLEEDTEELSHA